jgi:hypothetical protein
VSISSGTLTINDADANLSNSLLRSSGNMSISNLSGSNITLVSAATATIDHALTDSKVFANNITHDAGGAVAGGIVYAQNDFTSDWNGAGGGVGSSTNPTLLVAGNDIYIDHNANVAFYGLVFANDEIKITGNGGFDVYGAMVANSSNTADGDSSQMGQSNGSGNVGIYYSKSVLDALHSDTNTSFVNEGSCNGGGNKKTYISNSKVTVY